MGWGIHLWLLDTIDSHIGFGVWFLAASVNLLIIAFALWWGRSWNISVQVKLCFIFSVISFFGYLFGVVFVPKYFSYTGITSIFMTLAFIFVCVIHFSIDNHRNKISLDRYLRDMGTSTSDPLSVISVTRRNGRWKNLI